MTPLESELIRRIRATGPITIADYMRECMMHPEHGYYSRRDPLGADGDFITAPEISQMFGEIAGLALAQSWMDQNRPSPFLLAELGPGRGTLMADILRAAGKVPGFAGAAQVHLIEASPALRARQNETLGNQCPSWHGTVDALPDAPLFLVANEFFDALPIRQFVRDAWRWRERQIGVSEGRLEFGLGSPASFAALDHRLEDTRDGDLVEVCAPAIPVVEAVASRIDAHGGAALIVDYGDWRSCGDTLQAVSGHRVSDPLAEPGEADLTAHVDFEALANAAARVGVRGPVRQGVFLERLGITDRARSLAEALDGPALDSHIAAHRRLTHPDEMGSLFKVLGLAPHGAAPLAGMDP